MDNEWYGLKLPPLFDLVGPGGVDEERAFEHGYLSYLHGEPDCPLSKETCPGPWASWVLGWDQAFIEDMGIERTIH